MIMIFIHPSYVSKIKLTSQETCVVKYWLDTFFCVILQVPFPVPYLSSLFICHTLDTFFCVILQVPFPVPYFRSLFICHTLDTFVYATLQVPFPVPYFRSLFWCHTSGSFSYTTLQVKDQYPPFQNMFVFPVTLSRYYSSSLLFFLLHLVDIIAHRYCFSCYT